MITQKSIKFDFHSHDCSCDLQIVNEIESLKSIYFDFWFHVSFIIFPFPFSGTGTGRIKFWSRNSRREVCSRKFVLDEISGNQELYKGIIRLAVVCLFVCLSVCMSDCPSVHQSVRPFVCPSVRPSVRPSKRFSLLFFLSFFLAFFLSFLNSFFLSVFLFFVSNFSYILGL